ncbi:MAG: hypothetical protein EAZ92_10355 [Candidatus Kapaibacterium sp.]|nr:MAG: hypothetical protein EAZ92_10355 [Candidatus Kapabacteria bacterium]
MPVESSSTGIFFTEKFDDKYLRIHKVLCKLASQGKLIASIIFPFGVQSGFVHIISLFNFAG